MLFAGHEFRRTRRMKDGATEGEHAESAQKILEQLGQWKRPEVEVVPPQCPMGLRYLWQLFQELSHGLLVNGMTPQIVTWADLRTWRKEMRLQLDPWEKLLLMRLGALRFLIWS